MSGVWEGLRVTPPRRWSASAFAVQLGGETLTVRTLVGGAFVVAAMYLVELAPRPKVEAEVQRLVQ